MSFWRKHKEEFITSNEFKELTLKLVSLSGDLTILQSKIKSIETDLNDLRGTMNKKLDRAIRDEKKETNQIDPFQRPQSSNSFGFF
jgi:hypothetical protein